jgi:hypothetical protein
MKVCPDCGNAEFTQRQVALVEISMQVSDEGYPQDGYEEIVDCDRDDATLKCSDCGNELDIDDLISEDEYNNDEWSYP